MAGHKTTTSRRRMLNIAASFTIGAAGLPGISPAETNKRSHYDLLKVGLILGDGAHSHSLRGRQINCVPNVNNVPYTPRCTGLYYTHVWSIDREKSEQFAKTHHVNNVVNNFDDIDGKVDGVIIDAFFYLSWHHKLARPYLESEMPLFVNRPFADSMRKAKKMIALAKKHQTPIMTSSSFEHFAPVDAIDKKINKDGIRGYVVPGMTGPLIFIPTDCMASGGHTGNRGRRYPCCCTQNRRLGQGRRNDSCTL